MKKVVKDNNVLALKADYTRKSPEIKAILEKYDSKSIPFYLIFPANNPGKPIVLRDLITKSQVLDALEEAGPSRPSAAASNVAAKNAQNGSAPK